jgi:hypothetical protein
MRRSVFILMGLLAVAVAVFGGSFYLSRQICVVRMSNPADDLGWLRTEFGLSETQMVRIRQLHDGYLPKCAEMCARIAVAKQELKQALAGTNFNPVAEAKLRELGELRASCQARMLEHFSQVSQAMPAKQGQRYLAEMQRLTLGFHEQIEQSMSPHSVHEHHTQ